MANETNRINISEEEKNRKKLETTVKSSWLQREVWMLLCCLCLSCVKSSLSPAMVKIQSIHTHIGQESTVLLLSPRMLHGAFPLFLRDGDIERAPVPRSGRVVLPGARAVCGFGLLEPWCLQRWLQTTRTNNSFHCYPSGGKHTHTHPHIHTHLPCTHS